MGLTFSQKGSQLRPSWSNNHSGFLYHVILYCLLKHSADDTYPIGLGSRIYWLSETVAISNKMHIQTPNSPLYDVPSVSYCHL